MMYKKKIGLIVVLCWFSISTFSQRMLRIGDAAPNVHVLKWVKGPAFQTFGNNIIYVIEFTASWCIPCRAAAPHLSRIAKEYKEHVKVMGVCIWENNGSAITDTSYVKRAEEFVKAMGERMDYSIAVDDPSQTMANTWMKAAKQYGIPMVFVVDQNGKIAWIGNPSDLTPVIVQVLERKKVATTNTFSETMDQINISINRGDFSNANKLIDTLIVNNPENKYFYVERFKILEEIDKENVVNYGWQILKNECKNDENVLFKLLVTIVDHQQLSDSKWFDLALNIGKNGLLLCKDSIMASQYYDLLAQIYAKRSDYMTAVHFEQVALAKLQQYPKSDAFVNTKRENIEYRLNQYRDNKN